MSGILATALGMGGYGLQAHADERLGAPEPARACPRYGPGFVEMPGTTSCIRIGGRVRAEAGGSISRERRADRTGLGASARLSVDTRTDTAYGPLRTFVRVRAGSTGGRPD